MADLSQEETVDVVTGWAANKPRELLEAIVKHVAVLIENQVCCQFGSPESTDPPLGSLLEQRTVQLLKSLAKSTR